MDLLSKDQRSSRKAFADICLVAVGGPDRPPSKRMIQQAQSDAQSQGPSSSSGQQEEGYWAYMQRQINERTERLGLTNDAMENLENNSASFADDVSKFVQRQKRGAVKGGTFFLYSPQTSYSTRASHLTF